MKIEALTFDGQKLLPRLQIFSEFYLAGGTALALQLGHRISVDFDFFSPEPIAEIFLAKFYREFLRDEVKEILNSPREFSVLANGVKVTFLQYPFALVDDLVKDAGLKMASVREIGAMKAYTIGRRSEMKDYVDMRAVLLSGISLNEVCDLAEKKFGQNFSRKMFLQQLVYLDDVENQAIRFLGGEVNKEGLSGFFADQVRSLSI